jgi:hypothetical protein
MTGIIKRQTFQGVTQEEVWRHYDLWRGPQAYEIEIVKVHPIKLKLVQDQTTTPNAYSMVVEWREKPD